MLGDRSISIHTIDHDNGDMTIHIRGEMDAKGCSLIRDDMEELANITQGRAVTIDIKEVSFLDSSGIGAIVYLFKRIRGSGGQLSICNANGQPLELMELLRIHSAIPVHPLGLTQEAS